MLIEPKLDSIAGRITSTRVYILYCWINEKSARFFISHPDSLDHEVIWLYEKPAAAMSKAKSGLFIKFELFKPTQ